MSHTKTARAPDDQVQSVRAAPAMANVSRPIRTCDPGSRQRGKRGPTSTANHGTAPMATSTDVASDLRWTSDVPGTDLPRTCPVLLWVPRILSTALTSRVAVPAARP
jgi:hypothetical protein